MESKNYKDLYILGNKLGEGGFGTAYKAVIKNSNKQRALKITDKNKIRENLKKSLFREPTDDDMKEYNDGFYNEITNMQMMEGDDKENINTVKFYEYYDTDDEFVIVMELCHDNLMNIFIKRKNPFNDEEIYEILSQLNYSFRMMVAKKLIHRDLKLDNILIKYENEEKTKFTLKLTDYGTSKEMLTLTQKFNTKIGTCNFMAPEVLKSNPAYNQECDLWSLGIIIYILAFKKYPYNGNNNGEVLNLINSSGQKNLQTATNKDLDDLIKKLLNTDPSKRLNWKNYFNHPFFVNRDFKKYYDIDKSLGEGGYGKVYSVTHKKNNQKRAIKIIDKKKIREDYQRENIMEPTDEDLRPYIEGLTREIENMVIVEGENRENKNTVKFYEYFETKDEFGIVMELCDDNLFNVLIKRKYPYNAQEIKDIFIQLNKTFQIMINKKLIHRDLKLENILIKKKDKETILKLTDYGASKQLLTLTKKFSTKIGTRNYMAPEVLNGNNYNAECDLWSIGIMMYILFFKKFPYVGETETAVKNNIDNFGKKIINKTNNAYLDDLINKLLIKDPKERITWDQYFKHDFFTKEIIENQVIINLEIGSFDKKDNKFNKIYFLENDFYLLNNKEIKFDEGNEELKNLNETNTKLFINGKQQDFKKYFIPEKEGNYEVKIIFTKKLKDCSYMFRNCNNITSIDLSSFDSSDVTNMYYMFGKCHYLKDINLKNLNTQNVKDMSYMFNKCRNLQKINFPQSFNTQEVTKMNSMFHNCDQLSDITFGPSFKTNKVTHMQIMFGKCSLLKNLDLRNFNTEKVKDMNYMFDQCINLEEIKIDPTKFITSQVDQMGHMFNKCEKLKKIDLSSFIGGKITMSSYMFANCKEMNEINLSHFNVNEETIMNNMFNDCSKLQYLDLSSFKISNNDNTKQMFDNLTSIKKIKVSENSLENCKKFFKDIENKFSRD